MISSHNVTLIYGDGIGKEVISATKKIMESAGVKFNWEICEAGAEVFKKGLASGVPQETIDSIQRNKIALKGPLATPIGFGEKSANVTLRKLFETYANIRPIREFPGVITPYSGKNIDLVVVRENVEDLYAGIEYMQTPNTAECLKIITRRGCEKIVRFAFEFARSEGRKTLHCATKANIMKLTEGLMKRVFEEISQDYPDIESQHIIIDNCAHQLVRFPERFETIVTTNMNGDIISDLASGLVGGLGFAPGANLGKDVSIFEAVHGSAPKYAGQNVINPTAVLLSGVMMLRHLGEFEAAKTIEQALFFTLGHDKILTRDVAPAGTGVSTTDFTDRIIANFGKVFDHKYDRNYKPIKTPADPAPATQVTHQVQGVDIFLETTTPPAKLGAELTQLLANSPFQLKLISSRGVITYPATSGTQPDIGDHSCCRIIMDNTQSNDIVELLHLLGDKYRWVHVEKLNAYNNEPAYSKAQGEA